MSLERVGISHLIWRTFFYTLDYHWVFLFKYFSVIKFFVRILFVYALKNNRLLLCCPIMHLLNLCFHCARASFCLLTIIKEFLWQFCIWRLLKGSFVGFTVRICCCVYFCKTFYFPAFSNVEGPLSTIAVFDWYFLTNFSCMKFAISSFNLQ